jgi:hypothetical protein
LREVCVESLVRFNPLKNDCTGPALVMHLLRIVTPPQAVSSAMPLREAA